MKSKKKIEKAFKKLIDEVKTKKFYTDVDLTNRVNCYACARGHITKTKDVDSGCTPFMLTCEVCGGLAHSTCYNDIAKDQEPTIEWYRPTLEQLLKMREDPGMLEHVLNGGLDYRKIGSNE